MQKSSSQQSGVQQVAGGQHEQSSAHTLPGLVVQILPWGHPFGQTSVPHGQGRLAAGAPDASTAGNKRGSVPAAGGGPGEGVLTGIGKLGRGAGSTSLLWARIEGRGVSSAAVQQAAR